VSILFREALIPDHSNLHLYYSWYGWSAQAKMHWIMPIIGSGIFGFGMMTTLYVLGNHK